LGNQEPLSTSSPGKLGAGSDGVAGVILAAGKSSRMGRDKALLPLHPGLPSEALAKEGRRNFLEHLMEVLRGEVSLLLIVLGHHATEIEGQIAHSDGAVVLRNPNYPLGQLSSLHVALRYLESRPASPGRSPLVPGADQGTPASSPGASGVLVCLVDHPAITRRVVRLLLERFEKTHAPIVIPTDRGRRGHPILFARRLFQDLLDAPLEEGARFVVRRHAAEVDLVETGEEGILLDVDLPGDYERFLKRE